MNRLLPFACLVLVACHEAPVAPDVSPEFLIGSSPLSPITLDKTVDPPLLEVPLTVNRGITQVAIEDKFLIRISAELKVADCAVCAIGPRDFGIVGQKDADVRGGSDVGIIMDIDIPAPTWDAIKGLTSVPIDVVAELVMLTGSGSEKILDSVTLAGFIIDID